MTASEETFDDTLRAGIAALRAGDRPRAMSLLARAVRLDPTSEQAWLFLAGAVSDPAQRRTCLERVIGLNPHNEAARRGLQSLDPTPTPSPRPATPAPPPPAPDPVNRVIDLLGSQPPAPSPQPATPAPPPPAPEPQPPAPATGVTVPLEAPLVSLPIEPSAGPRRPADRLVWSLILALGLLLMIGAAIYAAILLRG